MDNLAPDSILLSKSECILKLQEDFIHEWEKQLWSDTRRMGGNKLRLYREFKSTSAWENYLSWVIIRAHKIALSRLRTSCHQLEIEVGRHHKPPIPENERICEYCSTSSVDNETHVLLECPATDSLRQTLLNTVQSLHPHFQNLSSIERMKLILASTKKNIVCEAASYTYRAFEHQKRLTATTATK